MLQLRELRQHEMTVEEYLDSNIEGRTELLGGIIYDVAARYEPHRYAVRKLSRALSQRLSDIGDRVGVPVILQPQDAVAVPHWKGKDAPEIDIAVIADRFYEPIATSADGFAFIEVSHTTYESDRGYKIPLYVAAGVPSWIVNISERWVEFYGSPADLELPNGRVSGDTFEVLGVPITVASLLGPA
jgi:hypothetical protein